MSEHDVLFGFRLRVFTLAEELGNVSAACRAMGIDGGSTRCGCGSAGVHGCRTRGCPPSAA